MKKSSYITAKMAKGKKPSERIKEIYLEKIKNIYLHHLNETEMRYHQYKSICQYLDEIYG